MLYNKAVVELAILADIFVENGVRYRFQNFSQQNITYLGNSYRYVPMDYKAPARALELENQEAQLVIPNLPEIREFLEDNDFFIDAVVDIKILYPNELNVSPLCLDSALVAYPELQGATIVFQLESPTSAVRGSVPNLYFTSGISPNGLSMIGFIPEAPLVLNTNIS